MTWGLTEPNRSVWRPQQSDVSITPLSILLLQVQTGNTNRQLLPPSQASAWRFLLAAANLRSRDAEEEEEEACGSSGSFRQLQLQTA